MACAFALGSSNPDLRAFKRVSFFVIEREGLSRVLLLLPYLLLLLRCWTATQSVVPRTTKVNRMESNLDLFSFDLSDAEMQQLDALDGSVQLVAS